MQQSFDVIIVGAGPGGSTAAARIAQAGYQVLLVDKGSFPRDKSCGDGLTRTSTKILHELGLLKKFTKFQKIRGVEVYVEGEGIRKFEYPDHLSEPNYGLVVPRIHFDDLLCQNAVESGAVLLSKHIFDQLLYDDQGTQVTGIRLKTGEEFYSDIVIGADGASSKIAYQSGLAATPKNRLGFGLRAYYTGVKDIGDKLQIYLPILDISNKRVLPSYGWVFPVDEDTVNIGVGLMERTHTDNVHSVMKGFVDKLKKSDKRFSNMSIKGKYFGAPMRFDFNPHNSYSAGLLLVGDAAGLISPFTGEGIGYAMETGILAADYYLKLKPTSTDVNIFSDLSEYGDILASKYQGYFEAGVQSTNRYHLVWKVLKSTFRNDKPLFEALRQATVFPEGIGESFFDHYTKDVSNRIAAHKAEIRTDMLSITENIINITRKDWPFLSKLFTPAKVTPGIPFRPSLFLLLPAYEGANGQRDALIKLGVALELGFVAATCHASVLEDSQVASDHAVNWGNILSILVGDFLLSKSFEIIASLEGKYSRVISEALATSNRGLVLLRDKLSNDVESLTLNEYMDISYLKNQYTFELCLHLGSVFSNLKKREVNTLRQFGKYIGAAYFIIEDTIKYMEQSSTSFLSSANPMYAGNRELSMMYLLSMEEKNNGLEQSEKSKIGRCMDIVRSEMKKARFALDSIDNAALKSSLQNMINFVLQKTNELE